MSRPPSDPVARLAKLDAARAEIKPGETFNGADMAKIAGMTWRNMREIVAVDPEFPVEQRGSEGVPFVFDGVAVLDHMIGRARDVLSRREATAARASHLAGLGADAGPSPAGGRAGSGSGARELMDDARALSLLIDARAKLRAEMVAEGRLIDRSRVDTFLWRWVSGLQSDVLAIEQRIDKAGRIEPSVRQAIKDELAATLVSFRGSLEKQIGEWDAARHR